MIVIDGGIDMLCEVLAALLREPIAIERVYFNHSCYPNKWVIELVQEHQ